MIDAPVHKEAPGGTGEQDGNKDKVPDKGFHAGCNSCKCYKG